MPFGLSDGLAVSLVYVLVEPQPILKLHWPSKCYNYDVCCGWWVANGFDEPTVRV